jgi:Response regulator containing a CheY-like receiver domain and an HTH DNA-binding domain
LIRPRVLLADDHREFLEAESALLRPYCDLVGTASDGRSLISEVLRLKPDVVVVDITMPVMNGIDAVRKLIESGSAAKFVFLTINTDQEFVKACLNTGARGYVWKSRMKGHLIPAIRAVLEDLPYISPLTST